MAASDKPFRNQYTLDIVFGVSNILMLLSVIWMLWQDYDREYKHEMRAFREIEVAMAQHDAVGSLPSKEELQAKEAAVLAARIVPESKEATALANANAKLKELKPQKERADARVNFAKADVDSKISFLNIAIEAGESDKAQQYRAELGNLNKVFLDAAAEQDKLADQIKEQQKTVSDLTEPMLKATGELKKLNDRFDSQVKLALKKRWTIWDILRTMPVINGFADPLKIQQFTINDIPIDYNFKYVTRFDRCTSCHVGIDKPNFTRANLEELLKGELNEKKLAEARQLYDGRVKALLEADDSKEMRKEVSLIPNPHELQPVSTDQLKSRLTSPRLTEFAAHPRLDLFVGSNSKHPAEKFGCSSCHYGQGSGTDFLNASHSPNNSETRDKWKHDRGWEPAHMWDFPMLPTRFAESSCLKCHHEVTDLISTDNRVEAPKLFKGYSLIRENGCFGCHEISGWKSGNRIGPDLRLEPVPPLEDLNPLERFKAENDPDNRPGNLRKVGPSLARISEKVSEEWIKRWLYAPSAFRPDTKMPHYYNLSTNSKDVLAKDPNESVRNQQNFPNTEMVAIAYFLTKNSKDHLEAAKKHHGEDAQMHAKDDARLAELLTMAKLDEAERKELDTLKRRIHLRKFPPLVDLTPQGYKADEGRGRILFTERGCLACHTHNGTEAANDALKIPALTSEALFGPNLSQLKAKLPADRAAARKWLVQWILNPQFHSPRSRMPVTHLTAEEATDVATWLLAQSAESSVGADWDKSIVTEPTRKELDDLAKVYLTRMMSVADMDHFLKGTLSAEIAPLVMADIPKDEQELYKNIKDDNAVKAYLGKKAVSRLGCFGCHDVPGFESAKSIGVGLNDWGKKAPERLAFEDIRNFYDAHYFTVPSLVDKDGKPIGPKDGKEPYEAFFGEQLLSHAPPREAYLNQKIRDPRSYDYNRILAWDDRARMPKFNFARPRKEKDEELAAFQARILKEEARARESVATFVLGLTAELVPTKSVNHPGGPRLAEVKGRQILDKYNCNGCHLIRPGVYDFKLGPKTLKMLEFAHRKEAADMKDQGEIVFPYHHDWVGRNPLGDRLTAYGVNPTFNKTETDEGTETYMVLRPVEALRFTDAAGKILNIPSSKTFFVSLDDVVADPSKITSAADIQRHFAGSEQYGGAFANLLVPYLAKRDPAKYLMDLGDSPTARASLPPILIGQGERTQADWLYQFLLNPTKIRKLAILRMPKFNMSKDEARALVDYFASVTLQTNPGVGLKYPFEALAAKDDLDGPYWRTKTTAYVARLKSAKAVDIDGKPVKSKDGRDMTSFEQRIEELTPLWERISKEQEASLKAELQKLEDTNKAWAADIEAKEKALKSADAGKKADLQKDIDLLKQMVKNGAEEKAGLEANLKKVDVPSLRKAWEEKDAYAADAYRMLTSRKLCLQCHQIGSFLPSEKDKQGPPLALASDRLRPGWIVHWVDKPQRFVTYASLMPNYFDASKPKWQALHTGPALEQIEALRDVLLNLPRVSQLPINRAYNPDAPAAVNPFVAAPFGNKKKD